MIGVQGNAPPTHSMRDWFRRLLTYWTLIAIVSTIALLILGDVGEDVAEKQTGAVDNAVRAWILAHQNPAIYKIAYTATWLGSPTVMVIVALVAGAWFYRRRGRSRAGVIVAAPAVGGLLSGVIKLLYGRARPAGAAVFNERTFSFPSGHAATSAAVMVTLCYVLARERMISWPLAIVIGGSVPLIVGLTRLYLDVHWTTDVVGGWAVGLLVAAVSAAVYERLRSSAPPAPDA
ncbi:MAG: phosphatase PAP2 family protein [Gemmatimonadota bacterium]|nr:phosphatase PAP2 family protein [Gemmatimonadota bacterium]